MILYYFIYYTSVVVIIIIRRRRLVYNEQLALVVCVCVRAVDEPKHKTRTLQKRALILDRT